MLTQSNTPPLKRAFEYAIVVDDKTRPREWGVTALRTIGFEDTKILRSFYGDHAFKLYQDLRTQGETVDLVLSDFHMDVRYKPPQGMRIHTKFKNAVLLSGIALAEAIFTVHSQQKFCLTSAGLNKEIAQAADDSGIDLTLYKRRPEDQKFGEYTETIKNYITSGTVIAPDTLTHARL